MKRIAISAALFLAAALAWAKPNRPAPPPASAKAADPAHVAGASAWGWIEQSRATVWIAKLRPDADGNEDLDWSAEGYFLADGQLFLYWTLLRDVGDPSDRWPAGWKAYSLYTVERDGSIRGRWGWDFECRFEEGRLSGTLKNDTLRTGGATVKAAEIVKNCRCCACDGPLGTSVNLVIMEDRRAYWKYPVGANSETGATNLAVSVVCDSCIENQRNATVAVEFHGQHVIYHALKTLEPLCQGS
jgi:hypothetical protein